MGKHSGGSWRWGIAGLAIAASILLPATAAAAPKCTITGTGGPDALRGTARADVICAFGGDDRITGKGADDRVLGGPGDDRILGGGGDDRLGGQGGDDTLVGGPGDDVLNGGPGYDTADGGPGENRSTGNEVTVDDAPVAPGGQPQAPTNDPPTPGPKLTSLTVSPSAVNTESASAAVDVVATFVDSDGDMPLSTLQDVRHPGTGQMRGYFLGRVSGTPSNGVYRGTISLPRYAAQGTWQLRFSMQDDAGNNLMLESDQLAAKGLPGSFEQIGRGDSAPPSVVDFAITPATVDTYAGAQSIRYRVSVRDDLTGVRDEGSFGPTIKARAGFTRTSGLAVYTADSTARLVSGTSTDGVYEGQLVVPRYSATGSWWIQLWTEDKAGNQMRFDGGTFDQVGEDDDTAPVLQSLSVSPTQIDTSTGDQVVSISARATDLESGIKNLWLAANTASMLPGYGPVAQLTRVSGTSADGTFAGELTIPSGSEPGDWFLSMGLNDLAGNHRRLGAPDLAARGFPSKIRNGP